MQTWMFWGLVSAVGIFVIGHLLIEIRYRYAMYRHRKRMRELDLQELTEQKSVYEQNQELRALIRRQQEREEREDEH